MTDPNQTLTGMTKTVIAQRMVEGGMSPEDAAKKAATKEADSKFWLGIAAVFAFVALAVVFVGLFVVSKVMLAGGTFPIVVALFFAGAVAVPIAGAIFSSGKASSEYMTTFLGNLKNLRKLGKGDTP